MGSFLRAFLVLWLVASAEAFRVHGASSNVQGAKGVQGGKMERGGGMSTVTETGTCKEGDLPFTCQAVTSTVRGGGTGSGEDPTIPLNVIKILLQVCLTSLNVVCWFVPMKIRKFVESKSAISLANSFSGGVFLSLAFGHMLPHSQSSFEGLGYPESLPYFLTLSGYMLIFFVEKVAFDTQHILQEGEVGHSGDGAHGGADIGNGPPSGRSASILLLALGVHALMETMALGISSSKLNASLLAMSIGLHQPAESLALLVSFLKSGLSERQVIKMLSIFSCVGPIGLGIGIAMSQFAGQMADAVLVAIAAGTFIYVGATEVIAEEFDSPHNKWKKFGALMSGTVIIACITSVAESLENQVH
ncbi:unnamed protein product [Choristocarpus tenellus]